MQGVDDAAPESHVCVAPRQRAVTHAFHVAQGYVHASGESLYAVDYANLAVVAIVHFAGESREFHRHEGADVNASLLHAFEEGTRHTPAAHVVIDDAYLDAFLCLLYECVGDEAAQRVVVEDVGFKMDVMSGAADGLQQRREELVAVGIEFRFVVLEG